MLDNSVGARPLQSMVDKNSNGNVPGSYSRLSSGNVLKKKADEKAQVVSQGMQIRDTYSGPDTQFVSQEGFARKTQIFAQVSVFHDIASNISAVLRENLYSVLEKIYGYIWNDPKFL